MLYCENQRFTMEFSVFVGILPRNRDKNIFPPIFYTFSVISGTMKTVICYFAVFFSTDVSDKV